MVFIPRLKDVLILFSCLFAVLYAAPNLAGPGQRAWLAENLPGWLPSRTVNLGLDLQGGSHLMLKIDADAVVRDRADSLIQSARPELRNQKIGYSRMSVIPGGVRIVLLNPADFENVRKVLSNIESDLDILSSEGGIVEAKFSQTALSKIADQTIGQSIEIVRRRVDESGTKEPTIARQGNDRIVVQLPGVGDPARIKALIGTTAKLTFHLLEDSSAEGGAGAMGGGKMILPMNDNPQQKISLARRAIITGDMLTNAQYCQDQNGGAAVCFRFNGMGTKRFCDVTRANVDRPFAIVLDDKVLSAPVIREPICGGSGQISGNFSVKESNDLALLLRAGALPAPLTVVEERTVGPSLGSDSVEAGKIAGMAGVGFVILFILMTYGPLFGGFAAIALVINIALIFAILSVIQATLTLPGIAGIILTIGMAVDANVLIFERMREEMRAGRSVISAIDSGYSRAWDTIVDANMTTLIAAAILFQFGSGPVKGFAVALTIGIVTSMYSAIMITRLMVVWWMRRKKPNSLPI